VSVRPVTCRGAEVMSIGLCQSHRPAQIRDEVGTRWTLICSDRGPERLYPEFLPQRIELLGRDGALCQAPAQRLQDRIGPRDLRRRSDLRLRCARRPPA
jgi:hypothetical protein